jgi:hypothetical protein
MLELALAVEEAAGRDQGELDLACRQAQVCAEVLCLKPVIALFVQSFRRLAPITSVYLIGGLLKHPQCV